MKKVKEMGQRDKHRHRCLKEKHMGDDLFTTINPSSPSRPVASLLFSNEIFHSQLRRRSQGGEPEGGVLLKSFWCEHSDRQTVLSPPCSR